MLLRLEFGRPIRPIARSLRSALARHLAPAVQLDIRVLVRPDRDVVRWDVGNLGQSVVEFLVEPALLLLALLQQRFQLGDFVNQGLRFCLIAGCFGLADLLGGRVSLLLGFLEADDVLATRLVKGDQPLRRLPGAAIGERSIQCAGVLAYPFDVEH